jgi:hypothetical protein
MTMSATNEIGGDKYPRKRKQSPTPVAVLEHVACQVRRIHKKQLIVPVDEYQRDESGGAIAKDIALQFNHVAFGALTVIERQDGVSTTFLVADGGTRLAGALMRDDIHEVRCLVFSPLTRGEEADVFLAINQNRRRLRVEQLQHSEVYAGRPHAMRVEEIMVVFKEDHIGFNALSALRACEKRMPAETAVVEKLLHIVACNQHVGVRVFKGLVYLENMLRKQERSLQERSRVGKLKAKFGQLDATVNAAFSSQAIRSSDPAMCARAIAAALGLKLPRGKG